MPILQAYQIRIQYRFYHDIENNYLLTPIDIQAELSFMIWLNIGMQGMKPAFS